MKNKIQNPSPKMEPLPGTVVTQWVRCGRRNCKCARGALHGPYHYRFWWEGRRRYKAYVRKSTVDSVRSACDAYRTKQDENRKIMREAAAEWRRLKALLKELGL